MAKKEEKPEADAPAASEPKAAEKPQAAAQPQATGQPQAAGPPQRVQIEIDESGAIANYANFCRITGTPEELIIDFGLNPQPIGIPTKPIAVTQRIITNFYTAKRMLNALQMTIQRHEATFGVLEIDVQKRVRPGLVQQPQPATPPPAQ